MAQSAVRITTDAPLKRGLRLGAAPRLKAREASVKFSVIVTNYNYKRFVVEAVDSALAQTISPFEIIVVDDGSNDGSLDLLNQRYAANPLVRILPVENQGQLSSFIRGFRECSGDVICFLDADDYWDKDYLQNLQKEYVGKPSVDCLLSNLRLVGQASGMFSDFHQQWELTKDRDFGVSALLVLGYQSWIGMPTSGLSMRRWLCQRLFDLPENFLEEWRTRADDCLVYGSDLLGAHKSFLYETAANYRVHDANGWFARRSTAVVGAKHELRRDRLVRYFSMQMGLGSQSYKHALLELTTKPQPTLRELDLYIRLGFRAPLPFTTRLRRCVSMVLYYFRARRRAEQAVLAPER